MHVVYHLFVSQSKVHPPDIEECLQRQTEEGLQVAVLAGKGRGVVASRNFQKNSFVCEYRGELITHAEAKQREIRYEQSGDVGCFVFKFTFKSKSL